jgi:hypothetical protein
MREYIRPSFKKQDEARKNKKVTDILLKLRQCHQAIKTISVDEESVAAMNALVFAYNAVSKMSTKANPNAAKAPVAIEFDDAIDVALVEVAQPWDYMVTV